MDEYQKMEQTIGKLLHTANNIPKVNVYRSFVERAYSIATKLRDTPYENKEEFREDLNTLCDLLSLELTK